MVDQISTLVNDTLDKINASTLLHVQVNATLQQLMQQQEDIEHYASQYINASWYHPISTGDNIGQFTKFLHCKLFMQSTL